MVISASRRTDIPAFYAKWFVNRLKEGRIAVRNPMNIHQITEWSFSPDTVDCIVFWTKNPSQILPLLKEIEEYKYYFQFTLNPYDKSIESKVPVKKEVITTFKKLSDLIGSDKVVWRYDPILLTPTIGIDYHVRYFEKLAKLLSGYTEQCVISFLDIYKRIESRLRSQDISTPFEKQVEILAEKLSQIAKNYYLQIRTCSEAVDLSRFGIEHSSCIDKELIERITGCELITKKDPNQRKECGCVQSVDIGEYNSCPHNCSYCYATYSVNSMSKKIVSANPDSSLIIGEIGEGDRVIEKKAKSMLNRQLSVF